MALLNDLNIGAVGDDPQAQIKALIRQLNEWGRALSNEGKTTIYKDASGTQRILIGEGADDFYGMKVSQEGFDVYSADDDDLVFNSSQNIPKIVLSGTKSLTSVAGSSVSATVDLSGLGFTSAPIAIVWVKDPQGAVTYYPVPITYDTTASTLVNVTTWTNFVDTDDCDIRFQVELGASAAAGYIGQWTFKYYVLQESAA